MLARSLRDRPMLRCQAGPAANRLSGDAGNPKQHRYRTNVACRRFGIVCVTAPQPGRIVTKRGSRGFALLQKPFLGGRADQNLFAFEPSASKDGCDISRCLDCSHETMFGDDRIECRGTVPLDRFTDALSKRGAAKMAPGSFPGISPHRLSKLHLATVLRSGQIADAGSVTD